MIIGVIGPSESEINPFIDCMRESIVSKHAMLTFHRGQYNNINIVSVFCGVCKVNAAIATQILIDRFDVTHVIVTGVAGAIKQSMRVHDTVISDEITYHDVAEGILTEYHPWMQSIYFQADGEMVTGIMESVKGTDFEKTVQIGRIVTGESFITQNGRSEIIEKYDPLCVDMETASIAHVCYANAIPFVAIRSISDTEEENGIENFEKNCNSASEKSIEVLKCYLEAMNSSLPYGSKKSKINGCYKK